MAVPTTIKNNGGLYFSLKYSTSSAVTFDDIKSYSLTPEAKDDVTFSEALAGTPDWTLSGTSVTSFDAGSLWQYLRQYAGKVVTAEIGPLANVTATPTQPHLKVDVKIPFVPAVEAEAGTDSTRLDFDFELDGQSDVTILTA